MINKRVLKSTSTTDFSTLIKNFKVDKTGIVHAAIGKVSFSADKIAENAKELIDTLNKLKPTSSKGIYVKSIYMSSTMSPSVQLDTKA